MPKSRLYSYIRWSSVKQTSGTSLDRQKALAVEIAAENGLELVEMTDAGLSAFKGKNVADGALGEFIEAVRSKVIPKGSWLVVENLDRISREDIFKAQRLFMELLELEVTIITGMDRKRYTKESVLDNPMELMYSIMLFARAHEESLTKSKRTKGNALAYIAKHENGNRGEGGYAVAIKSVGNNTWWSDTSEGLVKPDEFYFPIAKEIVAMFKQGVGGYKIASYLNQKYPPPPAQRNKRKIEKWSVGALNRFSKSRTLIGEKAITLDGITYTLEGYYPKVCSERDFAEIAANKAKNRVTTRGNKTVGLVSGIQVAKCGHCGAGFSVFTNTGKRKSGISHKSLRYICVGGQSLSTDCKAWSFEAFLIEDTLIRLCMDKVWEGRADEANDERVELYVLEQELLTLQEQVERGSDAYLAGSAPKSILKKLSSLEEKQERLKKEIIDYKVKLATPYHIPKDISKKWQKVSVSVLDRKNTNERELLRRLVQESFSSITIYQTEKRGQFKFVFKFIDGEIRSVLRSREELEFFGSLDDEIDETNAEHILDRMTHLVTWGTPPDIISDEVIVYRDIKGKYVI